MLFSAVFVSAAFSQFPLLSLAAPLDSVALAFSSPTTLNLTSLGARNNTSTIECWQLDNPFQTTNQVGVPGTSQLQLGDVANMSYTVVPPRYFPAAHNAPIVQFGLFISGEAHISELSGRYNATIQGGRHGLVIATDVAAVSEKGHLTVYPSREETILIQIPIKGGKVPPHKVLHPGPCAYAEGV